MNRDDEQRRATERDSQTNAANERMSQTEQAQREQEQQARLAREAQARSWPNASDSSSGQHGSRRRWIDAHPPMHLIGGDDGMAI